MDAWDSVSLTPSVDLKLGGFCCRFHPSSTYTKSEEDLELTAESTSKKARAPGSGDHVASCLVEGCTADLSLCREYHRRHKVCEIHSKTPIVIVNGLEKRFCQQCSRFHLLAEFDDGKRSCRKRLDGHNRRRRKPQAHGLHTGRLFSDYQGSGLSFVSDFFGDTTPHSNLIAVETAEGAHFRDRVSATIGSCQRIHNEWWPLTLSNGRLLETPLCHPLLPAFNLNSQSSVDDSMFGNGLGQALQSDLVLSHLSTPDRIMGSIQRSSLLSSSWNTLGKPQHTLYQGLSRTRLSGLSYLAATNEQSVVFSYPGTPNVVGNKSFQRKR